MICPDFLLLLQVHLDMLSVQATLLHGRAVTWRDSLRSYMQYISRLEAK